MRPKSYFQRTNFDDSPKRKFFKEKLYRESNNSLRTADFLNNNTIRTRQLIRFNGKSIPTA